MDMMTDIDSMEIEKRKHTVSRIWEHKKVDHIPINVWMDDFSTFKLKESSWVLFPCYFLILV